MAHNCFSPLYNFLNDTLDEIRIGLRKRESTVSQKMGSKIQKNAFLRLKNELSILKMD